MPTGETDHCGAERTWRLEAHDLRGGLSFATYRDAEGFDKGPADAPAYFIAAPSFAPEPVAGATVALAATRGGFAHGLFLRGEGGGLVEASFMSLSAVAEFVRRAYVASAGGDGPEGNEPPSPPLPEPPKEPPKESQGVREDSREEPHPHDDVHLDRTALLRRLDEQKEQIIKARPGESIKVDVRGLGRIASSTILAMGCLHVLRELLRRRPPDDDPQVTPWLEQLQRLGLCAELLGLWPVLNDRPIWPQWSDLLRALRSYEWWDPGPAFFLTRGCFDGFDLIGSLPLPQVAMPLLPDMDRPTATLRHLLVCFVASPHALLDLDTEARERVLDLICFAAACVVAPARLRRTQWNGWPHRPRTMSPVEAAQMAQLVADAMAWLEEHLPARVYERQLEERISASRGQRYQRAT